MPGYSKARFINVSELDLEEFSCGVCLEIYREPVFTRCCGQTYCRECISSWLQAHTTCPNDRKTLRLKDLIEPPRAFTNLLNKMRIKCDYYSNGCQEVLQMNDLLTHLRVCVYNPQNNCSDCGLPMDCDHNCIVNLKVQVQSVQDEIERLREENHRLKCSNLSLNRKPSADRCMARIMVSKMSEALEKDAIEWVNEAYGQYGSNRSEFAHHIKRRYESKYGRNWNLIMYEIDKGCTLIHHNRMEYIWFRLAMHNIIIYKSA